MTNASNTHTRTVVAPGGTSFTTTLTLFASVKARLKRPSSPAENAPSFRSGCGRQLGCISPACDPATNDRAPVVVS